MSMNREQAWALLTKYNKEPFHLRHAVTVEHVMGWFARELGYGEEEPFWSMVGLLHDLDFEQWPEEHCIKSQELMREADALIAAGDDEAAYARIRKADDDAVNDAIARLEAHARDHFAAVDVHMDAPAAIDSAEPIRVAFACPGEPAAESLVFGVSHTNVRMRYAHATPGNVTRTDDGLWHAAFAREAFAGYIAAPGTYEFALGGNTAAGGAFAGLVRIAFA